MAVYVDDMHLRPMGQLNRMKMSHMIADTPEELRLMAALIGVSSKHIQHPGTPNEHLDVAKSKRALAVSEGAIEITMREAVEIVRRKRARGNG